jgi:hypothetical protein
MTDEIRSDPAKSGSEKSEEAVPQDVRVNVENRDAPGSESAARKPNVMQLPGLVAIGLYLVGLAGVIVVGVVGGHYPPLYLIFPVFFFAGAGGLMLLFRWAWAFALTAVLLMGVLNTWAFSRQHAGQALIQGLLNWVFFLYLIRTEVRSKLR